MRRFLASLAVLLAVVAVPSSAHAATTPLDPLPLTMGTYTGWGGCDTGSCGADLDLIGRFAVGRGSFQSTATLSWSGPDDTDRWAGTITARRFEGPCQVRAQDAGVDPFVGVGYSMGVSCEVLLDGGHDSCSLAFSYTSTNYGDSSNAEKGNFFTWQPDPLVVGPGC